jgi:MFS family permease
MFDATAKPFRIRSLGLSVYVPTFLFAVGQGAVIPIIPLYAKDLGASIAMASFVVALRGIGTMAFDIPAGMLVGAVGERYAMVVGTVALAFVAVGAALTQSPIVFAALIFVMGCSWAIWMLARLSYVSAQAPAQMRGRALSLVGGTNRVGNFVGPLVGGAVASFYGLNTAFYLQAGFAIAAATLMFVLLQGQDDRTEEASHGAAHERFFEVVRDQRKVLLTAGLAVMCLGVLRNGREAIIPLWGDSIGLDPAAIGIVFGLSSAMDMLLFYPVGMVMDRFGRKWIAIPCLTILGLGLMLVPLAHSLIPLILVGLVTGFGNGMGSGIVMTLGADFSPPGRRAEFLGVWRLISDIGQALGPSMIGVIAAVATLGAASVATGGIGLVGAAIMLFFVAEPLPPRAHAPEPSEARIPG